MSSASRQNAWIVVATGLGKRLQFENKMLSRQGLPVLERGALLGSVAHLKSGLQSRVYLWSDDPYNRYSLWVLEVDNSVAFRPVADVLPCKQIKSCVEGGAKQVYIEHASYNGVPIHAAGERTKKFFLYVQRFTQRKHKQRQDCGRVSVRNQRIAAAAFRKQAWARNRLCSGASPARVCCVVCLVRLFRVIYTVASCYAIGHFPLSWHWGLVLRASRISIVLKACDPGSIPAGSLDCATLFALFLHFFHFNFGAISVYVAHGVAVSGYGTENIYLIAIRMVVVITASSIFALWSC